MARLRRSDKKPSHPHRWKDRQLAGALLVVRVLGWFDHAEYPAEIQWICMDRLGPNNLAAKWRSSWDQINIRVGKIYTKMVKHNFTSDVPVDVTGEITSMYVSVCGTLFYLYFFIWLSHTVSLKEKKRNLFDAHFLLVENSMLLLWIEIAKAICTGQRNSAGRAWLVLRTFLEWIHWHQKNFHTFHQENTTRENAEG